MQQESIDRVVGHQNDRPGGQKGQLLVQYQHAALDNTGRRFHAGRGVKAAPFGDHIVAQPTGPSSVVSIDQPMGDDGLGMDGVPDRGRGLSQRQRPVL